MTPRSASPRPLSAPSASEIAALGEMMRYCYALFPTYRKKFDAAGGSLGDIERRPLETLHSLPVMGSEELRLVSAEAVGAVEGIVDTETSSGSTGGGKTRFISYEDDLAEHEFLAELLRICGVGADDRVACLDTDPAAVMVSFPRACEVLGTAESYCLGMGAEFGPSMSLLRRLRPSVLVSVPSIIERALGSRGARPDSIRRVICVGEGVSAGLRESVERELGAEVFSYYGASETSALGIECAAHSGIHLPTSRHLFEIELDTAASDEGELVVTTLVQRALPILRYRLGDAVKLIEGRCGCGLDAPRVEVLGRSDMFASILGSKIHYRAIRRSLARAGVAGPMQVHLRIEDGGEAMALRMADYNRALEEEALTAILDEHPDVEFLHDSGALKIRFEFRPAAELLRDRKPDRLVDMRSAERVRL